MKARRKLIPAIVLLLVSVLMLSTASYAWFANTTEVTASGLSISAQAPTNLKIKRADQSDFVAGNIDLSDIQYQPVKMKLAPVTFNRATGVNMTNGAITWTTGIASDVNASDLKDGSGRNVGSITNTAFGNKLNNDNNSSSTGAVYGVGATDPSGATANTAYFVKLTYHVYAEILDANAPNQSLTLTNITLADSTTVSEQPTFSNLYKSIRVLVVSKKGNAAAVTTKCLIGDSGESENPFTYPNASSEVKNEAKYAPATALELLDNVALRKNASDTDFDTIEVYVFFEGTDANCKTTNLAGLDQIAVSLTFGVTPDAD